MNKRLFNGCMWLSIVPALTFAQAHKPDFSGVEILTHKLNNNLYMLEATRDVAGNMAVSVGKDGVFVVDSQYSDLAELLKQALKRIQAEEINYLVNSHYHDDHAEGNAALAPDALVFGTKKGRQRQIIAGRPAATVTFETSLSLHLNGQEIRLLHLANGHTDTDIVTHFVGDNVFHLGDLYNQGTGSFPSIDIHAGGTVDGLIANLEYLLQLIPEDAVIIPGHYQLSDRQELKQTYEMIVETSRLVAEQKKQGKSLEQIQQRGLPSKYKGWGHSFYTAEQWIANLYLAL